MEYKKEVLDIFENTINSLQNVDMKNELSKTIQDKTGTSTDKSKQIVDEISSTIDLIDKNYQDLKLAKQNGKSRSQWIKDKIDSSVENYSDEIRDLFIKELNNSINESNKEIGLDLFENDLKLSKTLTNDKYDGLNEQVIINNLQEQIKNNTILGSIISENGVFSIDVKHNEIQAVKKYYEEKLDSNYDKAFKTAVLVSVDIAKSKNLLPPLFRNKTSEEIAMIVDRGLTTSKVAYKISTGELNSIDAVEYTIDRNTAILNSVIITATTKYSGEIGGRLGATIGSIFGPTGTVIGTTIGTIVGKYAGHKIAELINEGVKKVANVAKSIVKDIGNKIGSVSSKLRDIVSSFF